MLPGSNRLIANVYLSIILIIASLFLFWSICTHNVQEWDEARNGANAWYMYHNHDFINYYYGNELDTWNAKPPLLIWLITLSYHIFGFNEFALRIPSVVASLLFFIVFFSFVKKYASTAHAFITSVILLGCRAVIAEHVGLAGDFDALLLLFLTCSLYSFCKYLFDGKKSAIYLCALFAGLAFYTKGTASVLYMPGMFLFLLLSKCLSAALRDYRFYITVLIFLAITASWIWLVYMYGKTPDTSFYGTNNSIQTMIIHDTYKRFFSNFESDAPRNPFFFFHTIEVSMNMWHILLYLAIAMGIYLWIKMGGRYIFNNLFNTNKLAGLSMCISIPLILVINFSMHPLNWYLAPVWPLLAYLIACWMIYIAKLWKPATYLWFVIIIFNLVKHLLYIGAYKTDLHDTLNRQNYLLRNENKIVITHTPHQNVLLYLHWMDMGFSRVVNLAELPAMKGRTVLLYKNEVDTTYIQPEQYFDEYCLAEVK